MSKRLFFCVIFLLFGFLSNSYAAPLYYTFEGAIVDIYGYNLFNMLPATTDYGLPVGDNVSYTFLVDTEQEGYSIQYFQDGSSTTISAMGSPEIDSFYTGYIGGSVPTVESPIYGNFVDQTADWYLEDHYGLSQSATEEIFPNRDEIHGGVTYNSLRISDHEYDSFTYDPATIVDWVVGLSFSGVNQIFSGDVDSIFNGYSTILLSNLTLTSISDTNPYDVAPVPEPSTIALMGLGLVGLAGFGRKKVRE